MTTATITCYRKGCGADAGHMIQLKSGRMRYVCFMCFHDFALEAPSDMPEEFHFRAYAQWRRDHGLPELSNEDLNAMIQITRRDSGYKFTDWEY